MKKIVKPLLNWYQLSKRDLPWRNTKSPYKIWISEIMLQQTRVETVIRYYIRFIETLPTIEALSKVDDELLMKLWEGLGYYSRARNLKHAAIQIMEQHGGKFPNQFEDILALKGIGLYTAGAIASIAFNQKHNAIDGNVLRVVSRIQNSFLDIALPTTSKKIDESLKLILPKQVGDFNQALMELGATICTPKNIQCSCCPIQKHCNAFKHQTQTQLPIKSKKIKRKVMLKTFFILCVQEEIAILKNEEETLFKGMWQLPSVEEHMNINQIYKKFDCVQLKRLGNMKHVFTHMDWIIETYVIELNEKMQGFTWVDLFTIQSKIALPTVYKRYIDEYIQWRLQEN